MTQDTSIYRLDSTYLSRLDPRYLSRLPLQPQLAFTHQEKKLTLKQHTQYTQHAHETHIHTLQTQRLFAAMTVKEVQGECSPVIGECSPVIGALVV